MNIAVDQIKLQLKQLNVKRDAITAQIDSIEQLIILFSYIAANPLSMNVKSASPLNDAIYNLLPANEKIPFKQLMDRIGSAGANSATNDSEHNQWYKEHAQKRIEALEMVQTSLDKQLQQTDTEIKRLIDSAPDEAKQAIDEITAEDKAAQDKKIMSGAMPYIIAAVVILIVIFVLFKIFGRKK